MFNGEQVCQLSYPDMPSQNDLVPKGVSHQKYYGRSFHHGRFVQQLRKKCFEHPSITTLEATVTDLITADDGQVIGVQCSQSIQVDDSEKPLKATRQHYAKMTFIADGCFSKFRKQLSESPTVHLRSHFVGAILHDCPLLMPNHGHVILAQPSPVLMYQIGTNDTRVLVDVTGKVPSNSSGALKSYMLDHVCPQLPEQLQPCFRKAVESQRLRQMPNSSLSAVCQQKPGVVMLGDSLNMRHPLTGGGMTVGFCDVQLLSELLQDVDFDRSSEVLSVLETFHSRRKKHCTAINVLAQALYTLFSAGDNADLRILRDACFTYFTFGGICIKHPISLLGGIIQSPPVLYMHFFMVAFVGIGTLLATPLDILNAMRVPQRVIRSCEKEDQFLAALLKFWDFFLMVAFIILSLPVNLFLAIRTLCTATRVLYNSF